jgi:putative sigma-54 modulation protein
MKIVYATKNVPLTDKMQAYAEKKLGKLEKFVADDTQMNVIMRREKGGRDIVEVTIYLPGVVLRAEETTDDLFTSIDAVADKLIRQIRRHRTRLEKRLRTDAFELPGEMEVEETDVAVARVKKVALKPMTPEDAAAQMELLGHTFYMFIDEKTAATCVIYRRNDGAFGLLMPED